MTDAVDYFCGAGGASLGLHDAGYDVVGFDNWPTAVATHNANGLPAHVYDLSDPALDHLLPLAPVAWFSSPCQPFSAAGDGAGEDDERDGFPWALRILARTLPQVAFFENVRGLTFAKHSRYFGQVLAGIRACGYHVEWKVLNTADYGVPQTRERCIIVARRDGGPVTWPTVTHTESEGMFTAKWVSMADALGWGLPSRPAYTVTVGSDDSANPLGSSWVRHRLTRERDDGRWTLDYRQTNRDGDPIFCDVTDRPSPTVGTKSEGQWLVRAHGGVRICARSQQADAIRLTIPELARLQDFPDRWQWCGTKTEQARQVGNACPPTLVRLLAEANRPS